MPQNWGEEDKHHDQATAAHPTGGCPRSRVPLFDESQKNTTKKAWRYVATHQDTLTVRHPNKEFEPPPAILMP